MVKKAEFSKLFERVETARKRRTTAAQKVWKEEAALLKAVRSEIDGAISLLVAVPSFPFICTAYSVSLHPDLPVIDVMLDELVWRETGQPVALGLFRGSRRNVPGLKDVRDFIVAHTSIRSCFGSYEIRVLPSLRYYS